MTHEKLKKMNKISLSFNLIILFFIFLSLLLLNRKINLTAANGTGETTGDENMGGDPIPSLTRSSELTEIYLRD
jgi:hypothetical protein